MVPVGPRIHPPGFSGSCSAASLYIQREDIKHGGPAGLVWSDITFHADELSSPGFVFGAQPTVDLDTYLALLLGEPLCVHVLCRVAHHLTVHVESVALSLLAEVRVVVDVFFVVEV